jgi:phosphatidylinositol glycan class N
MAYLAGLAFPTNSVGELPLSYLTTDPRSKAEALLANAKEILEMYHVKEEQKESAELRYRPYPGLKDEENSVDSRIARIQDHINQGDANGAIRETNELIQLGLQGLRYLQTYDWLFLRTMVTFGYIGWIVYAITIVIDLHVLHQETETLRTLPSMIAFSSILVGLYSVLFMQRSPLIYYAYGFFPVMFWEEVWASRPALAKGCKMLFGNISSQSDILKLVISTLGFFGVLEALVSDVQTRYTIHADLPSGAKLLPKRDFYDVLSFGHDMASILRKAICATESRACGNMGVVLPAHERVHSVTCEQSGRSQSNVRCEVLTWFLSYN